MILIIDYDMGNIGSVRNAVLSLGYEALVSSKKEDIKRASHLILPGVGTFNDGMAHLAQLDIIETLKREVQQNGKPLLGICLGMQIMARDGEEGGFSQGLDLIKGRVRKLLIDESKYKLPHIGWNDVYSNKGAKLFYGVKRPIFYFVHSFCFVPEDGSVVSSEAEYGERFTASVEKDNLFGCQFHPEKSQQEGLKVLENFLLTKPAESTSESERFSRKARLLL